MMKKQILSVTLAALTAAPFAVSAQTAEAPAQEKNDIRQELDLSGKIYLSWSNQLKKESKGVEQQNNNTFSVDRVYLNWKKKLDDVLSVRVTTDVMATESTADYTESTGSKHSHTANSTKYDLYIKYAYLQAENKIGELKGTARAGMVNTPTIGFIDDKLSDARWIQNNFIDNSKSLLASGTSIDSSADLGVNLNLKFAKLAEFEGAFLNGDGYKKVRESESDGKGYNTRVTLTPFESLYISGFFNRTVTDRTKIYSEGNFKQYYGSGLAWANETVKAGINYIITNYKSEGKDAVNSANKKIKEHLLDSWANIDFTSLAKVPLFLYGRFAMGEDKNLGRSRITYYGAGIGYTYSKSARFIVYTSQTKKDNGKESSNLDRKLELKAEINF